MRQPQFSKGEIIEGEYVALAPEVAVERPVAAPAIQSPRHAGMEALRRQDAAPGVAFSAPGGAVFGLFGAILIAAAFWIAGGHALVSR
jgi:hypothetical protein